MRSSCGTRKKEEEAEAEEEQRSEIENADEEATNERTLRSMETVKALSCFAQVSSSSSSASAAPLPASAEPTNERFQRALENLETSAPLRPPSLPLPHPPSHPSLLLRSLSFSVSCLNAGCTSQIHHLSVKRLGCVNWGLAQSPNHSLYPLL